MNFLVIDDHPLIRRGVREILLDSFPGSRVQDESTGESGLARLRTERWDLLILDLSLPKMGGLELLDRLRRSGSHVPVLILTMHNEKQFGLHAVRAGARGYVTKDLASEELMHAIKRVLAGGRWVSETFAERLVVRADRDEKDPHHDLLSPRELKVLVSIASGFCVTDIARQLHLSVKTVSTYRTRVLEKLQLRSNSELTRYCLDNQLLS